MVESKQCPKCSGNMVQGNLQKIGNSGNPPYEYAPGNEVPFMPHIKGQPNQRRGIVLYRCEECGFVEMYAP
jgi:uncharacterized Zn finger protein